ncbi:LamG domain-containing protein [Candidatus Woesearchaeota archaeon]|jgi:hypothetical protein|nr:LamG domain-containing protein [Candidatus Woesearchaeota archaeon]MBT6520114.1 LamG domain-containing protein [Candidatus Woesearchaeota archaeon]MBT7366719.1 LamG domain-containing protein [Candidatus Woesearchaeota archaeon]
MVNKKKSKKKKSKMNRVENPVQDNLFVKSWIILAIGFLTFGFLVFSTQLISPFIEPVGLAVSTMGDNINVSFVSPTPNNNSLENTNLVIINTSIVESNLKTITYNWNGTNQSLYDNNLILMMNLNNKSALGEDEGNVADISRLSNDGTVTNAAWTAEGKYGGAYYFDGSGDYISGSITSNTATNKYTMSDWILIDELGNQYNHFSFGETIRAISYVTSTGYLACWLGNVSATNLVSNFQISPDVWYYSTCTYNSTHLSIYVNGEYQDSAPADFTLSTNKYAIGSDIGLGGFLINGSIDDVKIWNTTLTDEEIFYQYQLQLEKYDSTHWQLTVNQTKNSTARLEDATYSYQVFATDNLDSLSSSGLRGLEIDATEPLFNFSSPTPLNGSTRTQRFVPINVSITEKHLTELKYSWDGTNYTAYDNSLVLIMNLDNKSNLGESSTYVVDFSNHSNNGSVTNAEWTSAGKYSGSFDFSETNNYITISDDLELRIPSSFSISVWVKFRNLTSSDKDFMGILGKGQVGDSTENHNYFIGYDNGDWWGTEGIVGGYESSGGTNYQTTWGLSPNLNQWYHLVLIFDDDANTVTIYGDGQQRAQKTSATGVPDTGSRDLILGRIADDGFNTYLQGETSLNGSIDELKIWDRALSPEEIYQQYVSNLKKEDLSTWNLYVNQSKNSTASLPYASYNYQLFASDAGSLEESSQLRIINIFQESGVPEFSDYAIMLILVLAVSGFVVMRKQKE